MYPITLRLTCANLVRNLLATDIPSYTKKHIAIYGNLVTAKGTPTNDKRLMHFGTFLEREGNVFYTVHFPNVSEKYPIISKGIYKITGRVVEEMEYYSIIAKKVEFQSIKPDPRKIDEGNRGSVELEMKKLSMKNKVVS
ncbi:MAG: hypothetical protein WBG48_07875 [Pricia sp.]